MARRTVERGWRALTTLLAVAFTAFACGKTEGAPEDEIPLPDRGEADASNDAASTPDTRAVDSGLDSGADVDPGPKLRVFATSGTMNARMGGVAGADKICATHAANAKLPGTFVAWLSTKDGLHATDRVTSAGPWTLPSGETVAETKAALVGGLLKHAIDRDEKGTPVTATKVWTGTGPDGRYLTNDCDAWTNGNNGRVGKTDETGAGWTSFDVDDCGALRRIYCFQIR